VQLKRWLVVAAVGLTVTAAVTIGSGGTGRPEPSPGRLARLPARPTAQREDVVGERISAGLGRTATRRKNITGAHPRPVAPRRGRRQRAAQDKHREPPPPEPPAPATPAPPQVPPSPPAPAPVPPTEPSFPRAPQQPGPLPVAPGAPPQFM
jgi:hypothetical protein